MFALCDAKTFYTSSLEVYCRKQPDGSYPSSNSPFDIVKRLIKPIKNCNWNLTTHNYFTSAPLADYLIEKKLLLLEPWRKINMKFHQNSLRIRDSKKIASYVPQKNNVVILLSTLNHRNNIDPTTKKQFNIVKSLKSQSLVFRLYLVNPYISFLHITIYLYLLIIYK